ncbi:flagellar basal body P-ring formation chaperone FlgA [Seleniivibrio sp.]|uniref:flagellar basal body P-ring formation chaperone FlgA n=1 Tax=Seleniivibrio sp. TaxID=2898801 RepID=UPI0025E6DEA9|nr:flagellar basal body P-ring formation chaperone FlgA [Seleniivibrio sp.]MCD8554019.1 flagellar basal body P-ring formation chaperone FlgA [Seleniivibrio sp.]
MRFVTLLILMLVFARAEANVILIDSECVTLRDIFPGFPVNDDVYCGLDYGQEKVINRQMAAYIINKYKVTGAQPGEATFKRRGTEITEDRFKEDIKNQLAVMYPDMSVEVEQVRMTRPFFTAENMQYKIDIPVNRFGNVSVGVDNGTRKYSYSVLLKAYKDVYVASSMIKRGELVASRAAVYRMDLSKVHGEPVMKLDGFMASINIPAGRPITDSVVEKQPDALKDSNVTIIYRSGNLEISAQGRLTEDAYEGKIVRAENIASGKIIRGTYAEGRKVIVNSR